MQEQQSVIIFFQLIMLRPLWL